MSDELYASTAPVCPAERTARPGADRPGPAAIASRGVDAAGATPNREAPELLAGTRIHQYEVIRKLDEGGMGTIYLAWDQQLGRRVAIKLLQVPDADRAARLRLEASTTARCRHDNVVAIHEAGEHAGAPFIVLEYLDGQPLTRLIEGGRRVDPASAVAIMTAILRALACVHAAGVVHRDVKPGNVFVTTAGTVKVLDFGIAKVLGQPRAERPQRCAKGTLTEADADADADGLDAAPGAVADPGADDTGAAPTVEAEDAPSVVRPGGARPPGQAATATASGVAGTLLYMSPEQWSVGAPIDHRADLWACGVVLYQLLAGHLPLPIKRIVSVRRLDVPMPSLAEAAPPGVPRGLIDVVDRCLRKRPEERWQSADELADALAPYLPAPREAPAARAAPPGADRAPTAEHDAGG